MFLSPHQFGRESLNMLTSEISSSDITNPSKTFKADHAKSDAFICDKLGVWVVVAGETELFIG